MSTQDGPTLRLPAPPPPPAPAPDRTVAAPRGPEPPWWLVPARIVLGAVALVTVVVVALAAAGSLAEQRSGSSQAFPEPVTRVRVLTDTGDVRVTVGGPGESARVTTEQRRAFRRSEVSIAVRDGVLEVDGRCEGGFGWFAVGRCEVDVEVRAPAGVPVEATSNTGDVEVRGPAADVIAATDTGHVVVRGATGRLRLTSDTGDVDALDVSGDTVDARTDTGSVRMLLAVAPRRADGRTDTGSVHIAVPADGAAYRVEARTDTGDTRVEVPEAASSPRTLTAVSDTGDVRVALTPPRPPPTS